MASEVVANSLPLVLAVTAAGRWSSVGSGSWWSVCLEDKAEDGDSRTTYTPQTGANTVLLNKQGHKSQRYEQKSSRQHQQMENCIEQRWSDKNHAFKSKWGKRKQLEEDSSARGYSYSKREAESLVSEVGLIDWGLLPCSALSQLYDSMFPQIQCHCHNYE